MKLLWWRHRLKPTQELASWYYSGGYLEARLWWTFWHLGVLHICLYQSFALFFFFFQLFSFFFFFFLTQSKLFIAFSVDRQILCCNRTYCSFTYIAAAHSVPMCVLVNVSKTGAIALHSGSDEYANQRLNMWYFVSSKIIFSVKISGLF